MCWKYLRLTFSSDLEEAMFETGESLSTIQNLILFLRSIHAHMDMNVLQPGLEN